MRELSLQETASRSMDETKGSGWGSSESRRRSDQRHESESRSLAEKKENDEQGVRVHGTGWIRDHKDNLQLQRQSPRNVEKHRDTSSDRRWRSDEGTRTRREMRENDCKNYVTYGVCYNSGCHSDHPSHLRGNICMFFVRGACKNGASCRFQHSMDSGDAEAMRQATSLDRRESEPCERLDERRHELESSSRPEKRARTKPDSRERDPRPRPDGINKIRLDQKRQEEERQMDIQRQRTEERMKREQMKPTVTFNDARDAHESLRPRRREGGGF